MNRSWKTIRKGDGSIVVLMEEGQAVFVKNDGKTGYGFVASYLQMLERNYKSHLMAVDLILQRQLGDRYRHIRKIPNVYNSYLAVVSLGCGFVSYSSFSDFEGYYGLRFRQGECPMRAICGFNGYHPANKGKRIVCCNPVYEITLPPSQLQALEFLVNTSYSLADIAESLNISEGRMRNVASSIYAVLEVESRQELTLLLRGKRIV